MFIVKYLGSILIFSLCYFEFKMYSNLLQNLYKIRQDAVNILETAKRVRDLLDRAALAQNASQAAIDVADQDIGDAENDLTQVG